MSALLLLSYAVESLSSHLNVEGRQMSELYFVIKLGSCLLASCA